ncbi:MAG: hypothetical protein HY282_15610 [Nitrospirae bacterium]|nr:hypothetical protein [Candidatus Manganitrophaceae bacterium]
MFWRTDKKKDSIDLEKSVKRSSGSWDRLGSPSLRRDLLGFLFFVVAGILVACGSGGGGGQAGNNPNPTPQTPDQAKAGAVKNIGGTSKSIVGALGKVAANSSASGSVLKALGMTPPDPGTDPTAQLGQQLDTAIPLILTNGTQTGNTVTFDPDEAALCGDPVLSQIQQALDSLGTGKCVDFYSHVRAVLTPGSTQDDGTLDITYDGHVLVTIGYAPSTAFIQFDLAELKVIASALVAQGFIDTANLPPAGLPQTLEGIVRTTFTDLGPDHGEIALSIKQAINIVDAATNINITLAAAENVVDLIADGPAGTGSASINLGALAAGFPLDGSDLAKHPTKLNLNQLTLHAELTPDKLIVTNLGIGGVPATLDATESPDTDFKLSLDTFGVTINGADSSITFDQAFHRHYDQKDTLGLVDGKTGTYDVLIPSAAKWTLLDSTTGSPLFKVSSGSVTSTSTGEFGSVNLTHTENTCFTLAPNLGASIVDTPCPSSGSKK